MNRLDLIKSLHIDIINPYGRGFLKDIPGNTGNHLEIDYSNIKDDEIVSYTMKKIFEFGKACGRNEIRIHIKNILCKEEEQENDFQRD